jgi:hypothetical protein
MDSRTSKPVYNSLSSVQSLLQTKISDIPYLWCAEGGRKREEERDEISRNKEDDRL